MADEDRLKAETAFSAMQAMGFQAATLGEKEFTHGLEFLKAQIAAHPDLFVSANVLDAQTKRPLAKPYVLRTYKPLHGRPAGKNALRVAITGFLAPNLMSEVALYLKQDAPRVQITEPGVVLKALIPSLRRQADVVVLLGHADLPTCRALAEAVPGIDLLVVGHAYGTYIAAADKKVNGATLLINYDRARYGAQAALTLDPAGLRVEERILPLSSNYPDNTKLAALRDAYKSKLAAMSGGTITAQEVTPVSVLLPVYGGNRFVGSTACGSCHPAAQKAWAGSLHAAALKTLETTKAGVNSKRPDCVKCHTVGFGQPSGFQIGAPNRALAGVGCESCHGPGQLHIQSAAQGVRPAGQIVRTLGGRLLCMRCHDKENDPNFDYEKDLEKIRHWGAGFPSLSPKTPATPPSGRRA